MTELNTDAGAAGSEQAPVAAIAAEGQGALSVTEGARALAQARKPREKHPLQAGSEQRSARNAPASELTAHPRLEAGAGAGDATSQETPATRGETENADPGAQEDNQALPPIAPPRSWTKEDKELFTSLPRETQERIAQRERSRESDFLRRQNEAADKLKGLTAKEQAVDQARQQYEAALPLVLQAIWNSGGKPDCIMVGGFNKQAFSTFTGRATPTEDTKAKKIVASVKFYDSDFGVLEVVPNRFMRARDALVLQTEMWAVAYLNGRKMVSIPLARTGDSERRQMLSEYTLVARNEKASGGVFDLTTS